MDRLDFTQGIENMLNPGAAGTIKTSVKKTGKKQDSTRIRRGNFNDLLEHTIPETQDLGPLHSINPSEEAVQILLDDVHNTGDNLKRRPLPLEMLEYKKAVRNFLNYVVENSYEIQPARITKKKITVRGEKRWEEKHHHQIRVVDQKLEELAAGILLKQINELELGSRLEEITGLLVDFTLTGKITNDN